MVKFHERSHHSQESIKYTNYVCKEIKKEMEAERRYQTNLSKKHISQVLFPDGPSYVVHWEEGSCTCLEFQDRLLPCRHAIAMAQDA